MALLEPISISDLRLETHHRGKVIFVRTFGHPRRISAIQNAVEDTNGDVDRLAVYNEAKESTPSQILPINNVFAVKEPFYKTTADGSYSLRVDHPSDLIRLQITDVLFPKEFLPRVSELNGSAMECKDAGNAAYARKDNNLALQLYTEGIQLSEPNSALFQDLHRNRAIVNLCLSRYEDAEADARASIIKPVGIKDSRTEELNSKALYRAGRAAYELAKYQEADEAFLHALELTPNDEDTMRQHQRCLQRLREAPTGIFDFEHMSKSATKKRRQLDHADFTANTTVRDAGSRGRGLFAAKDIKAGELVLCEKAFQVAHRSDANTYMILNINTGRGQMGSHASLMFSIVGKLRCNPKQATRFLDLYDGGYQPKRPPTQVDNTTVVDAFQVQATIEHNCFGCPEVRSSDIRYQRSEKASETLGSVGIWITPSYINHGCFGNACRSFIGDMMIVRATGDIARDEEIIMPYRIAGSDIEKSGKLLKKTWGFECDCSVCVAESKTPVAQRKKRQKVLREVSSFLLAHKLTQQYRPGDAVVNRATQLYKDLEKAYDGKHFEKVPRAGLVDLGIWLCQAYSTAATIQRSLDTAEKVLSCAGFHVDVQKGILSVERIRASLDSHVIDAAVYAAHAHFYQGRRELGKQYEDFARKLYGTLYGELRGFDERYTKD